MGENIFLVQITLGVPIHPSTLIGVLTGGFITDATTGLIRPKGTNRYQMKENNRTVNLLSIGLVGSQH